MGWSDIEDAPRDGSRFIAHFVDYCDEYDENDRLIGRNVPTPGVTVAYIDPVFGFMEYPYNGKIFQNRRYTHWHALPPSPEPWWRRPTERDARMASQS